MSNFIYGWRAPEGDEREVLNSQGEVVTVTHTGRMLGDQPEDGVFVGMVDPEEVGGGGVLRADSEDFASEVDHLHVEDEGYGDYADE
jgi:hypothetical protein